MKLNNLPFLLTEYPFGCQPVLYYDFGKICGGEIFDESGYGNNGLSRGRVIVEAGYNEDNGLDLSDGFIQLDGLNFRVGDERLYALVVMRFGYSTWGHLLGSYVLRHPHSPRGR